MNLVIPVLIENCDLGLNILEHRAVVRTHIMMSFYKQLLKVLFKVMPVRCKVSPFVLCIL